MSNRIFNAFTLAEVLITLGIIGVVAALTMPSLIANHQKQVTVTGLKKAYSAITQAITASTFENGDFSNWGLERSEPTDGIDFDAYQDRLTGIVQTYIIPYFKVLKDCGYNRCPGMPVATGPKGQFSLKDPSHYIIYLADGSRLLFYIDNTGDYSDPENPKNVVFGNLGIIVDINGDAKPNRIGRDIFHLYIKPSSTRVIMRNDCPLGPTRDDFINECKNANGWTCGAIIQQDSWQIKKDYPW